VHELGRRHQEIRDAGIHEVVVFHSTADLLRQYQGDLPFDVIGDPDKELAAKYGKHAGDQWSVDELLALHAGTTRSGAA
jgi:hypothetical protein